MNSLADLIVLEFRLRCVVCDDGGDPYYLRKIYQGLNEQLVFHTSRFEHPSFLGGRERGEIQNTKHAQCAISASRISTFKFGEDIALCWTNMNPGKFESMTWCLRLTNQV